MSVQWAAVASQKLTVPGRTTLAPDVTVAVKVTTVSAGTVVTGTPFAVTDKVVVVPELAKS
jgi:hypothetical protein